MSQYKKSLTSQKKFSWGFLTVRYLLLLTNKAWSSISVQSIEAEYCWLHNILLPYVPENDSGNFQIQRGNSPLYQVGLKMV